MEFLSCIRGLTLRELGEKTGMMFDAVSKAVARINKRMTVDNELKELYEKAVSELEKTA